MHWELAKLALTAILYDGDLPPHSDTPFWTSSLFAVLGLVLSLLATFYRARSKERLDKRLQSVKAIEAEFEDRPGIREQVELFVSSSPASASNVGLAQLWPSCLGLPSMFRSRQTPAVCRK